MILVSSQFSSKQHPPGELTVLDFVGTEGTNVPHEFEITLACESAAVVQSAMDGTLLGRSATLSIHGHLASATRRVRGHVRKVTAVPRDPVANRNVIKVELVSRLWLLTQHTRSRIFQDKTVREIIDVICDDWQIERTWRLVGDLHPCPYITQYNETDYEFMTRLLARSGIFFYPSEPSKDDTFDDAIAFQNHGWLSPIMEDEFGQSTSTSPVVEHLHRHESLDTQQIVFDLSFASKVRPRAVHLSDYDFRNPALTIKAQSETDSQIEKDGESRSDEGEKEEGEDARKLQTALFVDTAESDSDFSYIEFSDAHAAVVLEQERRDARVLSGASTCWRIRPGYKFRIASTWSVAFERDYVPIQVRHRASIDLLDERKLQYENTFAGIEDGLAARPPRAPMTIRAVSETATVIGEGSDVVTDKYGRVQVRFHWSTESSCWLRVSQPWAGASLGAQFIPRVGTEVLVTFLGGDMDRPLVVGSLYNGTHHPPFESPDDATRSGFRSKTSGGEGYNELSFEDRPGEEELRLDAQRTLTEISRQDHRVSVARNQSVTIGGSQEIQVGRVSAVVNGPSVHLVNGDFANTVMGALSQSVGGNGDLRVTGTLTQRSGREFKEVESCSATCVKEDATTRVKGHSLTIVGEHDKPTSSILHVEGASNFYSAANTEIVSESAIEIRCGKSSIRLTPDAIEIFSPNLLLHGDTVTTEAEETITSIARDEQKICAKKVLVRADGASLALSQIAKVDGRLIKLNCGPDPADAELPTYEPKVPTTFKLVDQNGTPMTNQRFRLVMEDGTERSGFLDEDGSAELTLEASGQIVFPDVDNPRRG